MTTATTEADKLPRQEFMVWARLSSTGLWRLVRDGKLRQFNIGKRAYYSRREFDAMLESNAAK